MTRVSNAQRFIINGIRSIEIETFDPGPVPDDGILVENEYTAVSVGTELYCWIHGHEWSRPQTLPQPTGYCSAGRVLATGKDVTSVQVGDRVASQGCHASHWVHTSLYHKIPDGTSTRHGALLVMAAIAIRGVRKAEVQLGHAVAVLGLGVVGQFAVSFARLSGARPIIGIDLNDFRLNKSMGMGTSDRINPANEPNVEEAVGGLCPADGADVVIEATGIPAVYPMAATLPRTAGKLVALGSPRGTVEMSFFKDLHLREREFIGAFHPITPEQEHIYYPWTKDRDRAMILDLMADEDRFPVEHLITHVAKPEQCQEIYEMLADEPGDALAVLFDWTKS